jgi:hypothetical protein
MSIRYKLFNRRKRMITLNEAEALKAGFSAVTERDESKIFLALDSLTGIALDFLTANEDADCSRVTLFIEDVAEAATEEEMELVCINSILALGKLAKTAVEEGYESTHNKAYIAVGRLGGIAAAHSLEAGSKVAATTLMEIWNLPKQRRNTEKTIAFSLLFKEIGVCGARQGSEEIVLNAVTCLGEIGKKIATENLELETVSVLLLLEEIGESAAEKYLDEALSSTALSIEEIGKISLKKKLHDAILQSQWALEALVVQAEERSMDISSVVAEMSLDNFKDLEPDSEEEKPEKFQEIRKLQKNIYSTQLSRKPANSPKSKEDF